MVWLGFPEMVRYWIFMVDILGRPSETLRLRCRQVIPPVRTAQGGYRRVAVHLHPSYYGIRWKTAELDDSALIDRPEIRSIMLDWCSRLGVGERLWICTLTEARSVYLQACEMLGLSHYSPTLYQG